MSGETKNANYTLNFELNMNILKWFYTIKYEIRARSITLKGKTNVVY